MNTQANTGDTVEFNFRGTKLQGTVIRFRIRTSRKAKEMERRYGLQGHLRTEAEVVEISVIDKGIYTVPSDSILSVVAPYTKEADTAIKYAVDLKSKIQNAKASKKSANYDLAEAHGLMSSSNPRSRSLVWVKYTTGLRQETMVGLSPSFQVEIDFFGQTRYISPKFVFATEEMARS